MSRIERFLFGQVSVVPLAVLRILTGAISFAFAWSLFGDLDPLLSRLRAPAEGEILWWQFAPDLPLAGLQILCLGLMAASAALALGTRTRAAAWAVFLLTLFLQRYNPAMFNGGDFILRGVLQLGVALGPSGSYLSLDARHRSQEATTVEAWPLRFIQLHISIGYLLTAYLKVRGQQWIEGTALWYALNLTDLRRIDIPSWLIAPPIGKLLTWSTLAVEVFVGIGVWWRRSLPFALIAGVALHLGIALTMEIGFFSLIMVASYVAFLPVEAFQRLLITSRVDRSAPALS
jgi:hypothetical protein